MNNGDSKEQSISIDGGPVEVGEIVDLNVLENDGSGRVGTSAPAQTLKVSSIAAGRIPQASKFGISITKAVREAVEGLPIGTKTSKAHITSLLFQRYPELAEHPDQKMFGLYVGQGIYALKGRLLKVLERGIGKRGDSLERIELMQKRQTKKRQPQKQSTQTKQPSSGLKQFGPFCQKNCDPRGEHHKNCWYWKQQSEGQKVPAGSTEDSNHPQNDATDNEELKVLFHYHRCLIYECSDSHTEACRWEGERLRIDKAIEEFKIHRLQPDAPVALKLVCANAGQLQTAISYLDSKHPEIPYVTGGENGKRNTN